ncbi:hypothetical protein GCM10022402_49980 [Salinactinospora qingdaonensis]|uniref:DUF7008 domain-containing protein n=1 Tax=Salinactinospora qingdaonensis TaxID=702744 RepID=A0ABP7GLA5_9ACTN
MAELYAPHTDLEKVVADLVPTEHVPYLAAMRYKDKGLAKRAEWEKVWEQQRAEDAAEDEQRKKKIRDEIPTPPKYASADFRQTSCWRNRGKLDVPKERFISYPYAGRDGASSTKDGSLLLGWAGFDHREQAQALAMLIVDREQGDGWGGEKLTPLLAGMREVLPWVAQWHGDFDPLYGGQPRRLLRRVRLADRRPSRTHRRSPRRLAPSVDRTRPQEGVVPRFRQARSAMSDKECNYVREEASLTPSPKPTRERARARLEVRFCFSNGWGRGCVGVFVVRSCLDRFAISAARRGDSGHAPLFRPPPAPTFSKTELRRRRLRS